MELTYKEKTGKSIAEATRSIKEQLDKRGYGILWELSFKDTLDNMGYNLDGEFYILEVCSPKQAEEMLARDIELGYYLPCKVTIYKKGSQVYIGMFRLLAVMDMIDTEEEIKAYGKQIESAITGAIQDAV